MEVAVELKGQLDVRLVSHVKQAPLLGSYKSLGEIAHVFFKDLKDRAKPGFSVVCPPKWLEATTATETTRLKEQKRARRSRKEKVT